MLFLIAPLKMVEESKELNKAVPLGLFVLSVVLVYIMGCAVESGAAALFFDFIGWGSYFWYALGFIPDARDVVWAAVTCCC